MITREDTYKKAFEVKRNLREAKLREHEIMLSKAYADYPRLKELDNKLAKVGAELAITALSGDTAKIEDMKRYSNALSAEKGGLLKKAGVTPLVFDCPLCNDTGYISGKICSCVKELVKGISVTELSKEMPLELCRFDNFDLKYYPNKEDRCGVNPHRRMTGILKLCREYVLTFDPKSSKSLLFMGDSGLGKTHLTLAIISGVIEKGYTPVYGPAANLFAAVEREKFSGLGTACYDTMISCDLLAIDDLGTEFVNSFTQSLLYNLINSRLLARLPTIINTNLSISEIKDRYTGRIASRLIGEYEARKFCGVDIRQQKKVEK